MPQTRIIQALNGLMVIREMIPGIVGEIDKSLGQRQHYVAESH